MSTTMGMIGAPILLAQTSLAQEKYNYNGEQKVVHNVIKNHPFTLRVGFSNDSSINFNNVNTEATLVYDQEGPEKEVDFVKAKPLEYFTHTNDKGDQLFVQIRIKVLSSQHEDMFFRVKLNNHSTITKEFIPSLTLYSQPIKVISKPDQIKKRNGSVTHDPRPRSKRPRGAAAIPTPQANPPPVQSLITQQVQGQMQPMIATQQVQPLATQVQSQLQPVMQTPNIAAHSLAAHILNGVPAVSQTQITPITSVPIVQHNLSMPIINAVYPIAETAHVPAQAINLINADQLIDIIKRIERNMQTQAQQLDRACQKIEKLEKNHPYGNNSATYIENAFEAMMKAYSNLKPNERTDKVRKLTKCGSLKEAERLSEFLRALWIEGIEVVDPTIPETPPDESMNQVDSPGSDEQPYPSDGFGGGSSVPSQYTGQNYGIPSRFAKSLRTNQNDFMGFLMPRLNSSLSREDPFSDLAE